MKQFCGKYKKVVIIIRKTILNNINTFMFKLLASENQRYTTKQFYYENNQKKSP